MHPDFSKYILDTWMVLALVWLIGAFTAKRTVRRQSAVSRLLPLGLGILAIYFFRTAGPKVPLLTQRFLPDSPVVGWIGLALTIAGVALAIVARFYLGRNWSGWVTIKEDHTLVRTGPYAFVRHPIYSGFLLGILGTALASGRFAMLIGLGLAPLVLTMKVRVEEKFMTEHFGEQYLEYKRRTKALIPYVW